MAGNDRLEKNRAVRQEALREQLQAGSLIQKTLERVKKLDGLDLEPNQIAAIKAANDASLRLLNKVLPDLKAMELSQDPDNPVFTDERALDTALGRLIEAVASAESRAAAPATSKGPVH